MRVPEVDPPTPTPGAFTLVFDFDSVTSTALYPLGGSVAAPAYVVSSEDGDATHVSLRTGAGADVGRVDFPGFLQRLRKRPALVTPVGRDAMPVTLPKGRSMDPVCWELDDKKYTWTLQDRDGSDGRGIYTLTCGGEEVARFVPSRSTEPAATRAHLVFFGAPAGLEAAAVRDQALLTLIAIKQLVNLAPKGVNASEMLAHGVAGALK